MRALVIDVDDFFVQMCQQELETLGFKVTVLDRISEAFNQEADVMFMGHQQIDVLTQEFIDEMGQHNPKMPIILFPNTLYPLDAEYRLITPTFTGNTYFMQETYNTDFFRTALNAVGL